MEKHVWVTNIVTSYHGKILAAKRPNQQRHLMSSFSLVNTMVELDRKNFFRSAL